MPLTIGITVAEDFDPGPLIARFAEEATRTGDQTWEVTFSTEHQGLALVMASDEAEILSASGRHPVDADGWADWQQSAPGESEMSDRLLPSVGLPTTGEVAYRYDDAWVWDKTLPTADVDTLRHLGLESISEEAMELANGKGDWAFKAIKLAWKYAKYYRDPRVQIALWLTQRGWEKLQAQSVAQRARMEQQEFYQRLSIDLADIRRKRLEEGSESSKRRARQYYSTLDALIAANS